MMIACCCHLSHASKLNAGFAQIDISPKIGDVIDVMTGQQKTIEHINDPLLAKAVYLKSNKTETVLISLDVIGLFAVRQEVLTQKLKLTSGIDNLILTVTHTHSGILPTKTQQSLTPRLIELINSAKQNLQQVNMSVASTQFNHAYKRIINQNGQAKMLWSNPQQLPTQPADLTLGVINLTTKDNRPFITLVNYNAHPVITMNRQKAIISADYPARLAYHLKRQYGANTLFLLGAAGDINPFNAGISDMDAKPLKVALTSADKLGKALANKVIAMVNNSTTIQKALPMQFKSTDVKLNFVGNAQKSQFITAQSIDTDNITHQVNTLSFGKQLAFATFGGEFFSDFNSQLKQQSPFTHTFFIGYANGNIGYIPSLKALEIGGYGADKNRLMFEPKTGKTLISHALRLLNK